MRGATHRCQAILLEAVNYGEADRIVTLLAEDLGKIAVMARGARSSRHRYSGVLEPFALLDVSLARGRGKLPHLTEASLVLNFTELAGSLERIGASGQILELVRTTLPERQPEPAVFALVLDLFSLIAKANDKTASALALAGTLRVLSLVGLGISVRSCTACGTAVPAGRSVFFDPRRGGIVCTPCGGGPVQVSIRGVATLWALERDPLEEVAAAAAADLPGPVVSEVEHLLETFLAHHLDRPLKSAAFLGQVRRRSGLE